MTGVPSLHAMEVVAQQKRAELFRQLHVRGSPLVLYNIWDAGSARSVVNAGAQALATSSSAVSASHGLEDGQVIPLPLLLETARRIVQAVGNVPLSVDFEGAYATTPDEVNENVARVIETGAIGINLEDQVVTEGSSWTNGASIYSVPEQVARIRAARDAADAANVALVINARTDLFLKEPNLEKHELLVDEVLQRAVAYANAGADCIFIPALENRIDIVERVCAEAPIPVNAMHLGQPAGIVALAAAGVARVSHGALPRRLAHEWLAQQARITLGVLQAQTMQQESGLASTPRGAIQELFQGMRTGDSGAVRAVLAPNARFSVLAVESAGGERGANLMANAPVKIQTQAVDRWVEAIGRSDGRWDEQIYGMEVRVDDRMASAWVPYTFYLDGKVSHCGVNSIELLREQDGWKITQLSDTRRGPCNCPDPLAASPKL